MPDPTDVPCNAAQLHRPGSLPTTHGPHEWIVQPDMDPVHCPGTPEERPTVTDPTDRLDQIRDAARLHQQQLIGTSELYAVIEARAAAPAVPAPATDRDETRARIADALRYWVHPTDRGTAAAAVLAVLPVPDPTVAAERDSLGREADRLRRDWVEMRERAEAGRAAVLLEAADAIAALDPVEAALAGQHAWADAAALLRRLAGEAQQDGKSTAEKAYDLGLTDTEYRAQSHAVAVATVRAAIPDMYAHVGFRLEDVLNEADAARQDPAQDGEAHPPQHAWRVETRDPLADEWAPGSQFASRPHAVERYETANSTAPLWRDGTPVERRLVRETTSYTVERSGQPETDEEAKPVHACPEPGDNGISRCCGRPPCEFVGEHVTRDPEKVTCRGTD